MSEQNTMQSTRSGDMQILTCSAVQGKNWVFNSWPLYQKNWPIWIILSLIYNFISIALTSMTFSVAISFIFQMGFIAGIYLSCKKTEAGEKLEIQNAFSAFNTNTKEQIEKGRKKKETASTFGSRGRGSENRKTLRLPSYLDRI